MKKSLIFLAILNCSLKSNVFSQSVLLTPDKIDQSGGFIDNVYLRTDGEGTPNIVGVAHGGSLTTPTSTANTMILLDINGRGFGTSMTGNRTAFRMFANESWTNSANGTGISFHTTANGTTSMQERLKINHNGFLGIGLTTPDKILDVNGRMRIRHTVIGGFPYTSGIWMSNSTNSLSDTDGAFYGMITDTQAGIYIGNAWRFAVNSNGNIVNTGFTQLGNTVPAGAAAGATAPTIKVLKLIGTTASTQGTSVSVNHGIPGNKILDYQVIVNQAGTNGVPPNYTVLAGFLYNIGSDSGAIYVANAAGNSANILSKPFRVYITYEE